MPTGALTGYFDVAQIVLYAFWFFFFGLILYLRKEDRREGYPLVYEDAPTDPVRESNELYMPRPKAFLHEDGHVYLAPPGTPDARPIAARPAYRFPGAPLEPTGNPMRDGIGTASYALRQDVPDLTAERHPRIVPIRDDPHHSVHEDDPNPIGMQVVAADNAVAGVVRDLWIDRSEPRITYLEVEVPVAGGSRMVLLPMQMATVDERRRVVRTGSVMARHFADAPAIKGQDVVTKLEEDMICAYFAGGYLYAAPTRRDPVI